MSITVVIPSYNRPNKVKKAILSIVSQTILPQEIIVVDDSSDSPLTDSIFQDVSDNVKCKLLRNDKTMGANFARNRGIEEAESEWISFLDDDDEFNPEKIEQVRKAITTQNNVDIIYHSATIYMVNEGVNYKSGSAGSLSNDIYTELLVKNIVGGTSVATIKKNTLMEIGGVDENLPALQDYDIWLRLAKAQKNFCYINKPLLKYHHETKAKSISKSLSNNKIAIEIIEKKHKKRFESLNKQQFKEHEIWKHQMRVHKSLMNRQYVGAICEQIILFQRFPSIKSFIELLVVVTGPKVVFKLKSIIN